MASYLPSCGTDVASHAIPFMPLHILHIPTVCLISNCIHKVLRQTLLFSLIHRWMYRCSVNLFKSTSSAGRPCVYLIWPGSTIDSSYLSQRHRWTDTHSEPRRPTTPHLLRPQLPCKVRNSRRSLQRAGQLSNSMTGAAKAEPTLLVLWIWLSPSVAKAELLTRSGRVHAVDMCVCVCVSLCVYVHVWKDVGQVIICCGAAGGLTDSGSHHSFINLLKHKVATC